MWGIACVCRSISWRWKCVAGNARRRCWTRSGKVPGVFDVRASKILRKVVVTAMPAPIGLDKDEVLRKARKIDRRASRLYHQLRLVTITGWCSSPMLVPTLLSDLLQMCAAMAILNSERGKRLCSVNLEIFQSPADYQRESFSKRGMKSGLNVQDLNVQ